MGIHLLTPQMLGLPSRITRARCAPLHSLTPAQAQASYTAIVEVLDWQPSIRPQRRLKTPGLP